MSLWGQPIKLIQFVPTSEFREYWWNDVVFTFLKFWCRNNLDQLDRLTPSTFVVIMYKLCTLKWVYLCFRMKIKWLISLMFIRLSKLLQTTHCMKDNLQRVNLTAPLCLKFWQCTVLYRGTKSSYLRMIFWYLFDPIWLK